MRLRCFSRFFVFNLLFLFALLGVFFFVENFRSGFLFVSFGFIATGLCFSHTRLLALFYCIPLFFSINGPFSKNEKQDALSACQNIDEAYGTYVRKDFGKILLLNAEIYCENKEFAFPEIEIESSLSPKAENKLLFIPANTRVLFTNLSIDKSSFILKPQITTSIYNETGLHRAWNRSIQSVWQGKRFEYFLSPENAALFRAILLGDRRDLSKERKQQFAELGIFHLFAISGLHTGILYLCFFLFLLPIFQIPFAFNQYGYGTKWNSLVSLFSVLIYLWWIGFPLTAVRSWWLLCGYVIGQWINYRIPGAIFLTLLANVFLLYEPSIAGNLSFQLSFLSVFVIFYLLGVLGKKEERNKWKKFARGILQIFIFSIAIELTILPLLAEFDANFRILSPFNNIFHILFLTWCFVPAGLLAMTASQILSPFGITPGEALIYEGLEKIANFWMFAVDRNQEITRSFFWSFDFLKEPNAKIIYYAILATVALVFKILWEYRKEKKENRSLKN